MKKAPVTVELTASQKARRLRAERRKIGLAIRRALNKATQHGTLAAALK
jgi:hypothetical protein